MITALYIQGYKLDLFEDDNIELKSSIAESQDISKVFTDSTNQFSVPATDNNNKAFKHFYNSNLVDSWDIFNKVPCVIELYGRFYKETRLKLNSVIVKSNKPTSYKIQLFGLLTSLKDLLGDAKLSSLDFSSYDFPYNESQVLNRLFISTQDVVCTTLSTKRLIYDSNGSTNNTDTVKNVAFNNGGYESGLPFNNTSTSILNLRIIEQIESKYGLTFSRDFLGTSAFSRLYLLLNGSGTVNYIEEQITFDDFTSDPTLYNNTTLLSTNLTEDTNTNYLRISIDCNGVNDNKPFTSIIKANGVEIHSIDGRGRDSDGLFVYEVKKSEFQTFENLTFHLKSESLLEYKYTVDRYRYITPFIYKSEQGNKDLEGNFIVSENMPDIKIIDYLGGLFKMFKLIAINTTESDVYIDTLENYYRNGNVKNITDFVDFEEINISTGKILNEINYKFSEPTTLLQSQFYANNDVYYGDLEFRLEDENGNLVDGDSIDIELPFENMIYEKILDLSGVDEPNFMYGYMANESLEPVNVKAHLHYVKRLTTNEQIKILTSSNSYYNTNYINVATHTKEFVSPQFSTVFGEEFNEYNGVLIQNTLYSNYHKSYIENIFYKNRRLKQFKCKNLPIDFLVNLKLNDVIEIKDQYYRIDKYNLNLITRECTFDVYNVKDLDLTPSISITTDSTIYTTDTTLITADNNS